MCRHQCVVVLLVLVISFRDVNSVPVEQKTSESAAEQPLTEEKDEPQDVETIGSSEVKLSDHKDDKKSDEKLDIKSDESPVDDESKIVEGKYIFLGSDGIPTEVDYEASPEKGFVVKSFKKDQIEPKNLVPSTDNTNEGVPVAPEEVAEEMYPGGFVRGLYTYMDTDGVPATVEYEAAPDTGFVVKNYYKESLNNKKLPGTKTFKHSTENFDDNSNNQNEQSKNIMKSTGKHIVITPLPSSQGLLKYTPEINLPVIKYVQSKDKAESMKFEDSVTTRQDENINMKLMLPRSSIKNFKPPKMNDDDDDDDHEDENDEDTLNSSYRFGFAVDKQSRHEESDSNGNVKGSYSYIGNDGVLTKVDYEAGANKGFVIKKMTHEPTDATKTSWEPVRKDSLTQNLALGKGQTDEIASTIAGIKSDRPIADHISEPPLDSNIPSESRKFVSVAPMEEVPQTNIEQSYPFSHVLMRGNYFQGQNVEPYNFDRENGFLIYGPPFSQQVSTDQYAVREMAERTKHHHIKKKPKPHHSIKKPSKKPHPPRKPNHPSFIKIEPDGSYSFAYKTNDHSRQQSIDANGNIHYSYQFKNKRDGNTVVIFNNKVSKIARTEESDAQNVSPNHEIFRGNPTDQESQLLAYPVPRPTVYQPLVNQKLPEEKLYNDEAGRKIVRRVFRRIVTRKRDKK